MYISKKILFILLLIFSFVFWIVQATSSISLLTESVTDWDIITSTYYNNLNWVKTEWWYCRYLWWKLDCTLGQAYVDYYFSVSEFELQSYNSGCELNKYMHCLSASNRFCKDKDYVSGFYVERSPAWSYAVVCIY